MQDHFDLSPAQWSTLRSLLDEALAREGDERARWLDTLGEEHAEFRPRLRALLAHADSATAQGVIDTLPKFETAHFASAPGCVSTAGEMPERIGPYRLIRELGSGGMASVWLARREDMLERRQVALKLPHGAWKRAGLAERLAREREILATLEHPNIARLYDAGVADDGQPYLAIEYVEGERLGAFADGRSLGVPARVRLALQVVRAVAHAHAQLVVHLDLKPTNILVTAAGEVKLLDFGIAKLLDQGVAAETELTQTAGRALTPDYAAPEQIIGRPIGTAADVYALGVVLFELLTGQRPYTLARESRGALEDAILRAQAPRPSAVAPAARRKALRGDLDTIVLEALKKQPQERYATVDALGDDLERWLAGRPVLAHPDSAWYRTRRFVRRHVVAIATLSAVVSALATATGVSVWQAREAMAAKQRADNEAFVAKLAARRATASQHLAEYLLVDMSSMRSHEELTAQLERAADAMRVQYADDPETRSRVLSTIAGRHRQMGQKAKFRTLAAEALAAARAADDRALAAHVDCWLARDAAEQGDPQGAFDRLADAIRTLRDPALRVREPGTIWTLRSCLLDRAAVHHLSGRPDLSVAEVEAVRALERDEAMHDLEAGADTLYALAIFMSAAGQRREALETLETVMAIHRRAGRESSPSGTNTLHAAARTHGAGGQPRRGLELLERLPPANSRGFSTDGAQAELRLREGDADSALASLDGAHAAALSRNDTASQRRLAVLAANAAQLSGDAHQARAWLERAQQHRAPTEYANVAFLISSAAQALLERDVARARQGAEQAARVLEAHAIASDPQWRLVHRVQARIALAEHDTAAALAHADRALAQAREQSIDAQASTLVGEDLALRAAVFAAAADHEPGRDAARSAIEHFERTTAAPHPDLAQARRLADRSR